MEKLFKNVRFSLVFCVNKLFKYLQVVEDCKVMYTQIEDYQLLKGPTNRINEKCK
jgi:hypothetical protein